MAKATTIKEALARWEEKTGQRPSEAKEIKLYAQIPPIEKMDASLSTLANCEKLSLSTNCIEKIANLNGLKNLRILSLGRNNIKNLNGLEAVGDTLEELWISYNFIEKLKGIHVMKKLKILYMSNNLVKDWAEFVKLTDLPCLEDLVFVGNPLEEKHSAEGNWIEEATKRVPKLKKLDEHSSKYSTGDLGHRSLEGLFNFGLITVHWDPPDQQSSLGVHIHPPAPVFQQGHGHFLQLSNAPKAHGAQAQNTVSQVAHSPR
ncbi:dynein light chain 1, axonemal isoform X1 [Heterocephalus glaber]|uniref:Dynein axonemal light chain 1 n=1 Tax=Heterocephalus glaber TaxID=10181 RepID=A0AAX6S1J2_HETGA|nr:dynein light chain 1, axonemal isoform X1 [Heterocephalus glaber]